MQAERNEKNNLGVEKDVKKSNHDIKSSLYKQFTRS